jgi:hypothetical protein
MDADQPHNDLSGSVTGLLVQAGKIEGGVHVHLPAEIVRKPRVDGIRIPSCSSHSGDKPKTGNRFSVLPPLLSFRAP